MSEIRAILLTRSGFERDRQWAVCLQYADRHGYRIVSIAVCADDAVAVARAGLATIVLAAYTDRRSGGDDRLRRELGQLACRLEHVRPSHGTRVAAAGHQLAAMYVRGGSVHQLAQLLDLSLACVRQELADDGVQLRPEDQ